MPDEKPKFEKILVGSTANYRVYDVSGVDQSLTGQSVANLLEQIQVEPAWRLVTVVPIGRIVRLIYEKG